MLRIVPHTVPRVGRSYKHFPDGFELHLLLPAKSSESGAGFESQATALLEIAGPNKQKSGPFTGSIRVVTFVGLVTTFRCGVSVLVQTGTTPHS